MSIRQTIALGLVLLGWPTVFFMIIGVLSADDPGFVEYHANAVPTPLPPVSEIRAFTVLLFGVPGAGLCLAGGLLWVADARRTREADLGETALREWSLETLESRLDAWLDREPWAPPTTSELDELAAQLAPPERARLARLARRARWATLPAPADPAAPTPTAPGALWWGAAFGLALFALFIGLWFHFATTVVQEIAIHKNLDRALTPSEILVGRLLGVATSGVPALLAGAMTLTGRSKHRRAAEAERRRVEHSRHLLATTTRWISRAKQIASSRTERGRLVRALSESTAPLLRPADRAALELAIER